MHDFISYGSDLIDTLIDLKDYLFTPFNVPLMGDVTIFGLILGGSIFGLLTFKIIKFFTDLVL